MASVLTFIETSQVVAAIRRIVEEKLECLMLVLTSKLLQDHAKQNVAVQDLTKKL